jgi:hypothetical protein
MPVLPTNKAQSRFACLAKARPLILLVPHIWMARGLRMNRFSAAAAISFLLFLIAPQAATAQTDQGCFPWQELRDGRCVAKPSQAPSPPSLASTPPEPVVPDQCPSGSRGLSPQCACPVNTHFDRPSGTCIADAGAPPPVPLAAPAPPAPPVPPLLQPEPSQVAVCDGGNVINGSCACPAGFRVMPVNGVAVGGRCVRTDAENCLGGEMTVSGTCQCNGQVRMSGDIYLLEFVKGKCIPKRCPVQTVLKDGKCIAAALTPAGEPEEAGKAAPAKEASTESKDKNADDEEHHHRCGRGMVRTHSGECVAVRRRAPNGEAAAREYYRMYHGMLGN